MFFTADVKNQILTDIWIINWESLEETVSTLCVVPRFRRLWNYCVRRGNVLLPDKTWVLHFPGASEQKFMCLFFETQLWTQSIAQPPPTFTNVSLESSTLPPSPPKTPRVPQRLQETLRNCSWDRSNQTFLDFHKHPVSLTRDPQRSSKMLWGKPNSAKTSETFRGLKFLKVSERSSETLKVPQRLFKFLTGSSLRASQSP